MARFIRPRSKKQKKTQTSISSLMHLSPACTSPRESWKAYLPGHASARRTRATSPIAIAPDAHRDTNIGVSDVLPHAPLRSKISHSRDGSRRESDRISRRRSPSVGEEIIRSLACACDRFSPDAPDDTKLPNIASL